jgi:hypothetical protein
MIGKLSTYIEQISDEFQSTFTRVDDNTLSNMLGFPSDYCSLIDIIRKYIPDAKVEFIKTGEFENDQYDIYFVKVTNPQ